MLQCLLLYTEYRNRYNNQHCTTVVTIILATTNSIYHHLRLYRGSLYHRLFQHPPGFKDSD